MNRKIISFIIASLTNDLRKPQYSNSKNKLVGHCYVASEAYYHLLGGKRSGWKPMFIIHENSPHWFLKKNDGTVIDITKDQFKKKVKYENAVGKGFLTRQPSKRSKIVIDRVKQKLTKKKNLTTREQ